MKVVDLFSGLGGFSAGAIAAGAEVILGVDHDPVPLKLWSANVSGGRAVISSLGPSGDAVSLPPPSPHLHVHASTPCTDLSPARGRSATPADVASGVCMLRWALDLVIERGDYSWSLENVSTPKTREVLADYAARFPEKVAFATLDAADFGSPQTRIRLIAGQPALVKLLQEMPSSRRVSVREAFAAHGLEVPAPYLKNQTRGRDGEPCRRSVEEQSFTICASHALTWATRGGETVKTMSARDSAVLMGFDAAWRLPKGSRAAQKAVGNAMCVPMSRAIVQAAICLETGQPLPLAPAVPAHMPEPLSTTTPVYSGGEYNRIKKRLRTIEALVRELHESVVAR